MNETNSTEVQREALTITERNLAALAATAREDSYLSFLIERARRGQGTQIAVLTNGMVIMGVIATGRDLAEHLDGQTAKFFKFLKKPESMSQEEWDAAEEKGSSFLQKAFDETSTREAELNEIAESDDDCQGRLTLEDQVELDALQSMPYLTLKDVQINAPGQVGMTKSKVLRIPVAAINGWWIPDFELDTEGRMNSSLTLWETPEES